MLSKFLAFGSQSCPELRFLIPSKGRLYTGSIEIFSEQMRFSSSIGSWPDISRMLNGLSDHCQTCRHESSRLVVTKQQCTNCISSPRETVGSYTEIFVNTDFSRTVGKTAIKLTSMRVTPVNKKGRQIATVP